MIGALWIGIIIGFVMGLTGSGGALISIPLLIHFLGMSLKEATVYSLLVVSVAAILNLISKSKNVDWKLAFWIVPFSVLGSYVVVSFKTNVSDFMIFILLTSISTFGIISVWWPYENQKIDINHKENISSIFAALLGFVLGVLTTLTGLGGGVLLVPALISLFRFSHEKAIATSLFPIFITSFFSFLFQWQIGTGFEKLQEFLLLGLGLFLVVILFPFVEKSFSKSKFQMLRKIIFTLIVIFSLIKIYGLMI